MDYAALLRPEGELLGEIRVRLGARPLLQLAAAIDRAVEPPQARPGAMNGEEQRLVGATEEDEAVVAARNDDHEAVFVTARLGALERLGGKLGRAELENRRPRQRRLVRLGERLLDQGFELVGIEAAAGAAAARAGQR